jgi:hypothetical protein
VAAHRLIGMARTGRHACPTDLMVPPDCDPAVVVGERD